MKQYYPYFLAVPALSYALFAAGLQMDKKLWTGAAWFLYALANVCFIVAYVKGE